MKVIILTGKPFAGEAVKSIRQIIESASMEVVLLERYTSPSQVLNKIKDADAIILRSDQMSEKMMDACKKLKIIVRAGAGVDNVDLSAATQRNIVVMNTPGRNANAVAELVFGMMVSAIRNFYDGSTGTELRGKKLGVHAYGNVGRSVASIAKGFGMDIYAYDAFCPTKIMEKEGIKPLSSAKELYTTCQYVSLHLPFTLETKHSIHYDLLSTMPHMSVLINTARKEVIDEVGLIRWMEDFPTVKYVTDVAPDNDEKFRTKFPQRYFSTPKKMGAQTAEANYNAGIAAARQIVDFFLTGNTKYQVN